MAQLPVTEFHFRPKGLVFAGLACLILAFACLPANAGYEGWFKITVPLNGDRLDSGAIRYALTAGQNRQATAENRQATLLDFRVDRTIATRARTHDAYAARRPVQRIATRAQLRPGARGNCGHTARGFVRGHAISFYCQAAKKHHAMAEAYQRYQAMRRAYGLAVNDAQLPATRATRGPSRLKHAYLDYWVAHNAYQRALQTYHLAVRARRGRRP